MATEVKNTLIKNTITSLNAIDDNELKVLEKFDAFKLYAEEALPNSSKEKVAWFISNAVAEVRNNRDLMEASKVVPKQLFGALMKSFQLGLPIGALYRQASLIPRNDKETGKSITLQLWTRAYKTLVDRTKKYKEITILPIREIDIKEKRFRVVYTNGENTFEFEPNVFDEDSPKVGYIAYTTNLETGNLVFKVYPMSFIEKRKALALTKAFWNKWPDEMETKTVLGAFCKNELSFEFDTQKILEERTESKIYSLDVEALKGEEKPELIEDDINVDDIIDVEDVDTTSDFDKGLKQQWDNERKIKEDIKEKVEKAKAEEKADEIQAIFG